MWWEEGFGRFVYEYLLDSPDAYLRHDWTNTPVLDSPEYVEWLQSRVGSTDNPMVVYIHRAGNSPTKVKEFLDRDMRLSREYGSFSVYLAK